MLRTKDGPSFPLPLWSQPWLQAMLDPPPQGQGHPRGAFDYAIDTQTAVAIYTYMYYSHEQYIQSYRAREQNLENK